METALARLPLSLLTGRPVLECGGLRKRFGEIQAVRGIGFQIAEGETYGAALGVARAAAAATPPVRVQVDDPGGRGYTAMEAGSTPAPARSCCCSSVSTR